MSDDVPAAATGLPAPLLAEAEHIPRRGVLAGLATLPLVGGSLALLGSPGAIADEKGEKTSMLAITGANGHLGRLVIQALLKTSPTPRVAALVRSPDKAADLARQGIILREADYDRPETLGPALAGIDTLLLIASNAFGRRVAQHEAVIDAAKKAGVKLIAYTSVLHADVSHLAVAKEHHQTEMALRSSGVPFVLLRNGWYSENYTVSLPQALQNGAILGSAGDGRIASAARADYAAAAAAVLAAPEDHGGRTYELAGDDAFTMTDLAAEVSRQSGKPVVYHDMPEADYKAALVGAGMPEAQATAFARNSEATRHGALFDDGHQLSRLIGRATTPLRETIAAALSA